MIQIRHILLLLLLGLPLTVQAALEIRITQGVEGAMPIAVVPFTWTGADQAPADLAAIIDANLHRSGRFAPVDRQAMPQRPAPDETPDAALWRDRGTNYVVIGRLQPDSGDRLNVQFQLFDVAGNRQLTGYTIPVERAHLRRAAHMISDIIYERLTGERGAFDTRVAYVSVTGPGEQRRFALQVADADGHNPRTIFRSPHPILSPAWSPDGQRIAYVSFENGRSEVFVQNVDGGERTRLAAFEGINSAPAWSPDGQRLALTLSRGGAPDVHIMNLADRTITQITRSRSIDTEAVWMPDGRSLIFTSDRAGQPQLYEVSVTGGQPRRLTFEGRYNGGASLSPDGRRLAMVHGADGRFRIALLDRQTRLFQVLTEGRADESPSFAPNGSMIIYATAEGGRGILAAVSADGRVHQRLVLQEGEVREPAWSPFRQ
ncbi:TolB protein [Ectothiorhodospira magna]|uniref:Tol-Pal system protein TolB n=1 Tax=Ectothiorhodospira magna TaxID=867345 RepID=A0A1H8ZC29_9GAMM|nr:Tol-Pal system beta propeller repeat protein TolB [Ectothiorhodospira magna]SEP61747.1 TolB protein [Ectothiorhodospira magna]